MRSFVLLVLLTACSQSSSHPAPLGDCPAGDHCNLPTGGGEHALPEGGPGVDEGGALDDSGSTLADGDTDVQLPPVDAGFE